MNKTSFSEIEELFNLGSLQVLNEEEQKEIEGGIIALLGLALSAFAVGYEIGRDLSKR